MFPATAASRAPAASSNSNVLVGTSVMRLARPGAWPLRPARCSKRATPLAEPICSTRSTGKKSTPKSSDEVATTARSRPSFRPNSTQARTSLSKLPWCRAMCPAQSGLAASSSWYQISACDRVLVNTKVGPDSSIACTTLPTMRAPKCPAQEYLPGLSGSSVSITSFFAVLPCTMRRAGAVS